MPTYNPGQILTASDLTGTEGATTAYSPTNANITTGAGGVIAARYQLLTSKSCFMLFKFTLGTGSAFGSNPAIGLPFTAAARDQTLTAVYSEAGVRYWTGTAIIGASSSSALLLHTEATSAGIVSSTAPFTWNGADADSLVVSGVYEIA